MTVNERFHQHLKPSTCKKRYSYKIYNAINKYGKENFYVETLETGIPVSELDNKEIEYIEQYNSFYNGYNSTPGGNVRRIHKWEDINNIINLFEQGKNSIDIAKLYDVHNATILRIVHGNGYYINDDPEECTPKALQKCVDEGLTNQEIADLFNMKKWTIERRLKKYNIRRRKTYIKYRENFDYEGLISDYLDGMKVKDICDKYEIDPKTYQNIKNKYLETINKV